MRSFWKDLTKPIISLLAENCQTKPISSKDGGELSSFYIALKLENEILQAQVQRLLEENAALQAQIPEFQKHQASKEDESLQKPSEAQDPSRSPEPLEPPEFEEPQKLRGPNEIPALGPPAAQESQVTSMAQETQKSLESQGAPEFLELPVTQKSRAHPMVHGFSAA